MKFDVIILAGGLGTRLKSVVSDVPKPMAPVAGKPFMEYILQKLPLQNVNQIILSVGYKYEKIKEVYGSAYQSIPLIYSIEEQPLGTGGGIKLALQKCTSEHCLIVNGDTLFDVDFEQFWQVHNQKQNDITLALKQIESPDRYGTVVLEKDRILKFSEKQAGLKQGLINGGLYWLKCNLLSKMPESEIFSFETEFLEKEVTSLRMGGYIDSSLFIDIGIPQDYERAQSLFA
ncbi:MAG: NTP transferase domain-containing protein [Bacteroidia bacterium]|nr:NTP transferase domain-containing protein [Bacteroidia bacterium]